MSLFLFFFFNDTATTEIYTLSLHDALPICSASSASLGSAGSSSDSPDGGAQPDGGSPFLVWPNSESYANSDPWRSEEHTSELQSHLNLVCRLLLEKKKHTDTAVDTL